MTVDEALDRLDRYEQIGLGSDVTALKTLRRYVERVREVEMEVRGMSPTSVLFNRAEIVSRLIAAREGRDG